MMSQKTAGQIREIGGHIEQFAGAKIRQQVMLDGEKAAVSSNPQKTALWVKDAMDRLDNLTDSGQREQIMLACGHNCIAHNPRPLELAKARRQKHPSEAAFLTTEVKTPPKGTRLELKGDILIQYYTPGSYGRGMRCYCGLMYGLHEGINASSTYCQCSRGFVEKYWEGVLGRPVRVELGGTAISGASECKFIIHL
jgi:hypothetical protein